MNTASTDVNSNGGDAGGAGPAQHGAGTGLRRSKRKAVTKNAWKRNAVCFLAHETFHKKQRRLVRESETTAYSLYLREHQADMEPAASTLLGSRRREEQYEEEQKRIEACIAQAQAALKTLIDTREDERKQNAARLESARSVIEHHKHAAEEVRRSAATQARKEMKKNMDDFTKLCSRFATAYDCGEQPQRDPAFQPILLNVFDDGQPLAQGQSEPLEQQAQQKQQQQQQQQQEQQQQEE